MLIEQSNGELILSADKVAVLVKIPNELLGRPSQRSAAIGELKVSCKGIQHEVRQIPNRRRNIHIPISCRIMENS